MKSAFFLYIFGKYRCYDIGTANEPGPERTGVTNRVRQPEIK